MTTAEADPRVDRIREERIELLESRIVELIHENDELRLENGRLEFNIQEVRIELSKLQRAALLAKQTYPIDVVAEMLWSRGFVPDEPTATVVHEYAWSHPDWFRSGVQTAEGAKYIRLGPNGLMFTHDGVNHMIEQFVEVN